MDKQETRQVLRENIHSILISVNKIEEDINELKSLTREIKTKIEKQQENTKSIDKDLQDKLLINGKKSTSWFW